MTKLNFSIIIPSFNQGNFIRQTIGSVLSQKYANYELIIVDGGSTDNTLNILKQYSNNKKVRWISEKDEGQTDAINKGFKMASGDILTWINSDDYYLNNKVLGHINNLFSKHDQCKWLTGDYIIVDKNGKPIQTLIKWYKKLLRLHPTYNMLAFSNFIIQPSTFVRKEVLETVGMPNKSLRYTMDYDWWLRIIKKYPLCVTKTPISAFRIHGTSKGGSEYRKQFAEELAVLQKYHHSNLIYKLHQLHNWLIVTIYKLIK